MNCRKATQLVSESLDRPLTPSERRALRWHLLLCRGCRSFQRQLRLLRDAVRRLIPEIDAALDQTGTLSEPARQRISAALARLQ